MDAWETLVAGSTLLDGDAWEHLNAQGGGGGVEYVVLADGLAVDVAAAAIEVAVASSAFDVTVDAAGIAVDVAGIEVEISLLSPEASI